MFLSRKKTQAQILELRSRSPKSVVNDSKNYNSLLFPIAETYPPYTTDGQYNIFFTKNMNTCHKINIQNLKKTA